MSIFERSPATALAQAHDVFQRWMGPSYDLTALDAALSAAAVQQLDGDPVWLLIVSGSGNAKTETVSALAGAGAYVTSTITSEGALLSATSKKETSKDATGGLLRKIGDSGVLVIKDVTSILSMNRDSRAAVLAALREVYDGRWERNVGTDGGRTLTWAGRLVLVGAVTTAYDSAHSVIASMGDRFALVRVDSTVGRLSSGRQALANVGQELQMRAELAEAAGQVLAYIDIGAAVLTDEVMGVLLGVADLVTLARTAVERDHRGEVTEAHAPEAPTRFAKMLGQLVRGCLAIGTDADAALTVALRVAGDSIPPQRLVVLADLVTNPGTTTADVIQRVQRPRTSVHRVLQELHILGLLNVDDTSGRGGGRYSLSRRVDLVALDRLITRNVSTGSDGVSKGLRPLSTDISGQGLWQNRSA
jgi:predicted transcriptional regulator